MKVLFQNRADAFELRGGDTTQMMETKKYLENLGVEVDISLDPEPDPDKYDLVHVFNIQNPEYGIKQVVNAKKNYKPVALSTIYWDFRYYYESKDHFLYFKGPTSKTLAKLDKRIPLFISKASSYRENKRKEKYMKMMLRKADIILPNSYSELELMATLFKLPEIRQKAVIVPNGILKPDLDPDFIKRMDKNSSLPTDYVLQVALFLPLKGQLNLIKALLDYPEIPLVFIGGNLDSPHLDSPYGKECVKLGKKRGNTFFLGEVPHEEIYYYYSKAKVHALPSLRESPGLATLEAAVSGANCVVSFHGPVAEYFGFDVFYCDPLNTNSIKKAVIDAIEAPKSDKLKKRLLKNFTWQKAAQKTLEAYEHLLS